ncbi:hypothetical protein [Saccharothrix coeruleofusca]|uniref:Uncharacterized protein n=1 Tax=Saccharothrix coeruleofusca TaxID=33919 RepID=A0A918AIY6_9PSEU|nr:hypothetical protein [Saccharothrix coeruleofusca]GGP42492.1 hypothetical protein GCM10010185_12470 [Saccharothrix coeruleofusca]
MSKRSGTAIKATKKPVIVLAGEDGNDRHCLRIVLEAGHPDARGRLVEINEQVRLRQASPQNLADRVDKLVRLAEARAARERAPIGAFFVHEDFDAIDSPDRAQVRDRVQGALTRRMPNACYVLATWEVEAWLLLFPQAVAATCSSWQVPKKYLGRDTAKVHDPKQVMAREVSRGGPRYRESDATRIFAKAAELQELSSPAGTNVSWQELGAHITSLPPL